MNILNHIDGLVNFIDATSMIMASVGSHGEKQRRARQVYVLKDVLGPVITDGFVGVCCKSLQKLCAKVKAEMTS
jgi:hypothetical protein